MENGLLRIAGLGGTKGGNRFTVGQNLKRADKPAGPLLPGRDTATCVC